MSYLRIETNRKIPYRVQFIKSASHFLSELLGQPEESIMISIHDEHDMRYGLSSEGAAFVQLKCEHLPLDTEVFTEALSEYIQTNLKISPNRIFFDYSELVYHKELV